MFECIPRTGGPETRQWLERSRAGGEVRERRSAEEAVHGAKNLRWRGILVAGTITARSGFVDGVLFVRLGGYFLSLMSGNSTRSSAAVTPSPLVALRRPETTYFSAALLLAAAGIGSIQPYATALLLAAERGVANVSSTRSGEVSWWGLTNTTGTLVKAGQALAGMILAVLAISNHGSNRLLRLRCAVLWAMITAGPRGGVLAYLQLGLGSLWIVGAGTLLWATPALLQEQHAPGTHRVAACGYDNGARFSHREAGRRIISQGSALHRAAILLDGSRWTHQHLVEHAEHG